MLFVAVAGLCASQVVPMGVAAWRLRDAATTFANYGVCMVGPTGPAALRDNPPQFWSLVRRRLVNAAAGSKPFEKCAAAAEQLSASRAVRRAHEAGAWHFTEYAVHPPGEAASLSVASLEVTRRKLVELAELAGPFAHEGYAKLVSPSSTAHEAPHPVEPTAPGQGSGLPAWQAAIRSVVEDDGAWLAMFGAGANAEALRSSDGGTTWHPTDVPSAHREAVGSCTVGRVGFRFSLNDDGSNITVESYRQGILRYTAPVVSSKLRVFAAACDEKAMVVATRADGSNDVGLFVCPHAGRCRVMTMPEYEGVDAKPSFPLDVARVDGTTIVASAAQGIVRVTSSRNDGRSWAPLTVALDAAEHALPAESLVPFRLLTLGHQVILYGASAARRGGGSYAQLVSDDGGASWRAPAAPLDIARR